MEGKPKGLPADISGLEIDIESRAYKTAKRSKQVTYTDDEIQAIKEEHFATCGMISNRERLVKDFTAAIKGGADKLDATHAIDNKQYGKIGKKSIKEMKIDLATLQDKVDLGYWLDQIEVYGFAFHDVGLMAFYTIDGKLYDWRALMHDEHQAQTFGSWNNQQSDEEE